MGIFVFVFVFVFVFLGIEKVVSGKMGKYSLNVKKTKSEHMSYV